MRILLARHGELEEAWQPDTGHLDPGLSQLGLRQAQAMAHELREWAPFSAVLTSPLLASRQTASAICEALNLDPPLALDALATLTPELLAEDDLEPLRLLQERAWSVIESLRKQHPPEADFLLCTHELPIRAIVCRAMGMSLRDYRSFAVELASLTVIEFRGTRTLLAALNDVCHLRA